MPNIGADMLTQAAETIKQRQSQYGPPEKNFKVIAARWNAHLEGRGYKLTDSNGVPVMLDMSDVAHMSADIKMARLSENMDHEDSWKDLAGYAACGRQVSASESAKETDGCWLVIKEDRSDYPMDLRPGDQLLDFGGKLLTVTGMGESPLGIREQAYLVRGERPPRWSSIRAYRRVASKDVAKTLAPWVRIGPISGVPDDLKAGDQIKVKYGSGDRVVTVGRQCVAPKCLGQSYIDTDGIHWISDEIIAYRRT